MSTTTANLCACLFIHSLIYLKQRVYVCTFIYLFIHFLIQFKERSKCLFQVTVQILNLYAMIGHFAYPFVRQKPVLSQRHPPPPKKTEEYFMPELLSHLISFKIKC